MTTVHQDQSAAVCAENNQRKKNILWHHPRTYVLRQRLRLRPRGLFEDRHVSRSLYFFMLSLGTAEILLKMKKTVRKKRREKMLVRLASSVSALRIVEFIKFLFEKAAHHFPQPFYSLTLFSAWNCPDVTPAFPLLSFIVFFFIWNSSSFWCFFNIYITF